MIIEFLGLPGAGKSTLVERSVEHMTPQNFQWPVTQSTVLQGGPGYSSFGSRCNLGGMESNYQSVAALKRFVRHVRALVSSPKLTLLVVSQMISSQRSLGEKLFAIKLFAVTLARRRLLGEYNGSDRIILVDEGIVQRAFTIFVDGSAKLDRAAVVRYARLIPLPDVLVYLKVDPGVALTRVGKRQRGLPRRFYQLSPEAKEVALGNAGRTLDDLAGAIKNDVGYTVQVLTLDTSGDEDYRDEFERYLRSQLSTAATSH